MLNMINLKNHGWLFGRHNYSTVKNWNADLLAFGAQGHSKLHYLMTGSVAKRLLQLSYIDMLVVPPA